MTEIMLKELKYFYMLCQKTYNNGMERSEL